MEFDSRLLFSTASSVRKHSAGCAGTAGGAGAEIDIGVDMAPETQRKNSVVTFHSYKANALKSASRESR